jgi:hypothetical protein
VDAALGRAVEVDAAGEEAFAGLGKSLARVMAEDGGGQLGNVGSALANGAVERRVETLGRVVDALGGAVMRVSTRLTGKRMSRWRACKSWKRAARWSRCSYVTRCSAILC